MKINALFNYSELTDAMTEFFEMVPKSDKHTDFLFNFNESVGVPELYKEVYVLDVPIKRDHLNEEATYVDEIVQKLNEFANHYNLNKICIARNIDELAEI